MKFLTVVNTQWNARTSGTREVISAPQESIDDAPKTRPRSKSIPAIIYQAFRPEAEPDILLAKDTTVIRSGHVSQPSNYAASEPPIALSFPPPTVPVNLALHSAGTITKHKPAQDSSVDSADSLINPTPLAPLIAPQVMGMDPLSQEFANFIQHIPSLYIGAETRPLILRETEDESFSAKFLVAAAHIAALARPVAAQAKASPQPPRLPPMHFQRPRPPSTFAFPPPSPPVPVRRDSASTLPVSFHSSPGSAPQNLQPRSEGQSVSPSATRGNEMATMLRGGPPPGARPMTMVIPSNAPTSAPVGSPMLQKRLSHSPFTAPRAFPCAQPQRVQPTAGSSPQMRPTVVRNAPLPNRNHAHIAPVRARVDSAPTLPHIGSPNSAPQRMMGPRLPVPPPLARDAYTGNTTTVRGPVAAHAHLFVPRPLLLPHQQQLHYPPRLASAPSSPNSPLFVSSANSYVQPQARDPPSPLS